MPKIAQQKVGQGIAAGQCAAGIQGRSQWLTAELPTRELIAELVEGLPVVLETKTDGVPTLNPGDVVQDLPRWVGDHIGTVAPGIADSAPDAWRGAGPDAHGTRCVAKAHVWDTPGRWVTAGEARNTELVHDVVGKRRQQALRVEEVAVPEPRFIHQARRESAGIGAHVLVVLGDELAARSQPPS